MFRPHSDSIPGVPAQTNMIPQLSNLGSLGAAQALHEQNANGSAPSNRSKGNSDTSGDLVLQTSNS